MTMRTRYDAPELTKTLDCMFHQWHRHSPRRAMWALRQVAALDRGQPSNEPSRLTDVERVALGEWVQGIRNDRANTNPVRAWAAEALAALGEEEVSEEVALRALASDPLGLNRT